MRFVFVFLFTIVAISHEQYHHPMMLMFRWIPPLAHQLVTHDDNLQNLRFNPMRPRIFIMTKVAEEKIYQEPLSRNANYMDNNREFTDTMSRRKNSGQPQERFLLNLGNRNTIGNFYKTATFTTTSTCTSVAISTCIPRANFRPVAPAAIPNCRRKRDIEPDIINDDNTFSQFPIELHPTEVQGVVPTYQSNLETILDGAETAVGITSSKDEASESNESMGKRSRKGRFLFLGQNFISSTTLVSYTVISTVFTSTFVPAQVFRCLPPGYAICPGAGK